MSTSYFLICPLFTNIILWCLSVCSLFSLPFHKNRLLLQNLLIPKTILTPSNYDHEYLTISCHWLPLSMNTAEGILQKLSSFPLNSLPAMRKQRVQVLRMSLYVFFVISSWSFPKQTKKYFLQQHWACFSLSFSSSFSFFEETHFTSTFLTEIDRET